MKIVPVVGETYYGNWRHYKESWRLRRLNGQYEEYNEARSTYTVKRALNVTPCHACPCRRPCMDFHGEFDSWECSLGADVVHLPTRMDNKHYLDHSLTTDNFVIGSENCPLIAVQHKVGTFLKPAALVTVYEIEDSSEYRLVPEVTE